MSIRSGLVTALVSVALLFSGEARSSEYERDAATVVAAGVLCPEGTLPTDFLARVLAAYAGDARLSIRDARRRLARLGAERAGVVEREGGVTTLCVLARIFVERDAGR